MTFLEEWIPAREVAAQLGVSKKTVHNRALDEEWPRRKQGNRFEYQPPADLIVLKAPEQNPPPAPEVKFFDLKTEDQRNLVLKRQEITLHARENGTSAALKFATSHFPDVRVSTRSVNRWKRSFEWFGLDGLVDQKVGKVGRKSAASKLSDRTLASLKAASCEFGVNGRQNIARAMREETMNADLDYDERFAMRTTAASKSHVPRSIRETVRMAPTSVDMIQQGDRAARLDSVAFTPGKYDLVHPGRAITADDMTANCYVWLEWPNERGYKVMRPQLLAMLDIGTLCFTNFRAICRDRGQYNHDDVWGLCGDYFDKFGIPELALFEGGTWRSNDVRGHRTGIDDSVRFGGLEALGVKLLHARLPIAKHIEERFNQLQYAADRCKGFSGRAERDDAPEALRKQLYQCEKGQVHPREYFLHLNEYSEHLAQVMMQLNEERNDGNILKGQSPLEAWAANPPDLPKFPENSRWLYRSSFKVVEVNRRGMIRIQERSGKWAKTHWYKSLELGQWAGRKVAVFWNNHTPENDAQVMAIEDGKPAGFLCSAQYVEPKDRFDATKEQLSDEARYKNAQMHAARVERKDLMPFLQRDRHVVQPSAETDRIGARMTAQETDRKNEEQRTKNEERRVNRILQGRDVDADEDFEITDRNPSEPSLEEEMEQLL